MKIGRLCATLAFAGVVGGAVFVALTLVPPETLDTSGLTPLDEKWREGDRIVTDDEVFGDGRASSQQSIWNGVFDKALVGLGVGAIVMALVLGGIFARKLALLAWRKLRHANGASRRQVIRGILLVGVMLVLYAVLSHYRYTYLPLEGRQGYIQVDNWFGGQRVCRAFSSGVACSDWR